MEPSVAPSKLKAGKRKVAVEVFHSSKPNARRNAFREEEEILLREEAFIFFYFFFLID